MGNHRAFLFSSKGSGRNLKGVLAKFSEFIFPTIAATFPSDYSVEDSVRELRIASVEFGFDAVFSQGVADEIGRVHVRLKRRSRFIGTLEYDEQKTALVGQFPPSGWFKFYHASGLIFSAFLASLMLWAALFGKLLVWWGPCVPVGMFAAELGIIRLNQWFDRNGVMWLSNKIEHALTETSRRSQSERKPSWVEKSSLLLPGNETQWQTKFTRITAGTALCGWQSATVSLHRRISDYSIPLPKQLVFGVDVLRTPECDSPPCSAAS